MCMHRMISRFQDEDEDRIMQICKFLVNNQPAPEFVPRVGSPKLG